MKPNYTKKNKAMFSIEFYLAMLAYQNSYKFSRKKGRMAKFTLL